MTNPPAAGREDDAPAQLVLRESAGAVRLEASGSWTVDRLDTVAETLQRICPALSGRQVTWDLSGVSRMDSAGMILHLRCRRRLEAAGTRQQVTGMTPALERLERLLEASRPSPPPPPPGPGRRLLAPLEALGRSTLRARDDLAAFLAFLGEHALELGRALRHPFSIRFDAIARNIQDAGIRALPIITLTSFLIGVVIAYQGAVQLQKFGANLFIVDMIGISVTRELAPLITAIVVAGRTGSSYTAQLGVMKITEEIDAMRVMGFEPHRFLVLPRILALMIALPLMIFFADLIGILGGMVVAHLHLNLSWSEFLHRLQNVVDVKHYWIGIVKGPFFAWLIAVVGCFRGLQVARNTESIGHYTTVSVVNAIFLVIACDALFSVVFTELGI